MARTSKATESNKSTRKVSAKSSNSRTEAARDCSTRKNCSKSTTKSCN